MKRFFYLMLLVASFSFLSFESANAQFAIKDGRKIKILDAEKTLKNIQLNCNVEGVKVYLNGKEITSSAPGTVMVELDDFVKLNKKMARYVVDNFSTISSSWIQNSTLEFKFVKDGYESKTVRVAPKMEMVADKKFNLPGMLLGGILFAKKKQYGIHFVWPEAVFCELKRDKAYIDDPTIVDGGADERVSRDNAGETSLERTILRWSIDSDPRGARIFYRVISSVPSEVKNTNENYLTTTPYEETRSFNILGLTYANSRDVTIEFKISKRGYEDQIKRFNVRQAIDQQEINAFFELVPKEE